LNGMSKGYLVQKCVDPSFKIRMRHQKIERDKRQNGAPRTIGRI